MELNEIKEINTVSRGEYIFHTPSQTIVLVGKIDTDLDSISGLHAGGIVNDNVENFKKIGLTQEEYRQHRASRCSGCKGVS